MFDEDAAWEELLDEIETHHILYGCGDPNCSKCQLLCLEDLT